MDQAAPAVCFADSDDDDWVDFDENELQTGIQDLYDEDSASDYNDDDDDEEVDLDEIEIEDDIDIVLEKEKENEQKEEKKGKFSLFGRKKENKNKKNKNKNNNNNIGSKSAMSAFSAAPKRNKKSKKSQLNKRMNRLREKQKEHVLPQKKDKKIVHRQRVNTNIISIDLGTLSNAADNISTGDAFSCKLCKSILSKHDELLKQYGDDIKLDDEDESIWICSFCNHINIIEIDDEEIPKSESVDYILAPPSFVNDKTDDNKTSNELQNESQQIIFCIDISGSMCVSQQIDTKHCQFKLKGNHLSQDKDDLSQFIEANANHLNRQTSDIQYVSRLQCVQTAVDEQLDNILKSNPNYKIGLVSFNNEVTVIGDAMSKYEIITGDKLNNLNKLKEIGENKCKINNNIKTGHDKLSAAIWNLSENGQTALGPALVVSIAMASAVPGSQVIVCTDGLANIGVGSIDNIKGKYNDQIEDDEDDDEEDEEDPVLKWYQTLGDYAISKGVIVNIISITDDGCKLENIGKIVEITNGNLKRINPLNLAEKFSGIIENESIATNCQAKMLLHPGLKFHNTADNVQIDIDDIDECKKEKKMHDDNVSNLDNLDKINEGRKIYKINSSLQDVGNVFEGTRIFFEYVINKEKRSEFKLLNKLPFQVQIEYSKKDGSKMLRVISQTKEITFDRNIIRNNLDFNVLAKYGTHITTELCAKGDYESSRAWTSANTRFLNKNANNKHQLLTLANYAQENVALDHQMQRQIQTEVLHEIQEKSVSKCISKSISDTKPKKKKRKKKENDKKKKCKK